MVTIPTPAYCRPACYATFRRHLIDVDSRQGLFRAASAIALHEQPDADLSAVEATVENLADAVAQRAKSRSRDALLAHLHDVLFDLFGLRGNTEAYYHPANSYLSEVLRTRRGLPISLVLVYQRVAQPLGLRVYGVNAPGHFLAEIEADDPAAGPSYVDPFYGGGALDPSEVLKRVAEATGRRVEDERSVFVRATHRQWLARMLTNLKVAFATAGRDRDVYAMDELHELVDPMSAER